MKNSIGLLLFFFVAMLPAAAQEEDLLGELGKTGPEKEKVGNAFKSTRVIMSHSIEMLQPGVLDFRILHRFGNVNQGLKEFFGLDQASIRLGLDYGIARNLTVGIGRGSYRKEVDGFLKWRLLQQQSGSAVMPVSVVVVGGTTIIGAPWAVPNSKYRFGHRVGYIGQVLVGRKFSEAISLQVMPTLLHRNLVETKADNNSLFAAGLGGRVKLTKRTSLNFDYYYVAGRNKTRGLHNPLSIGFDIETGGHVFQLHFTNAIGMNERAFLTETTNNLGKGDIQFGFNISRVFQLKKTGAKRTKA